MRDAQASSRPQEAGMSWRQGGQSAGRSGWQSPLQKPGCGSEAGGREGRRKTGSRGTSGRSWWDVSGTLGVAIGLLYSRNVPALGRCPSRATLGPEVLAPEKKDTVTSTTQLLASISPTVRGGIGPSNSPRSNPALPGPTAPWTSPRAGPGPLEAVRHPSQAQPTGLCTSRPPRDPQSVTPWRSRPGCGWLSERRTVSTNGTEGSGWE